MRPISINPPELYTAQVATELNLPICMNYKQESRVVSFRAAVSLVRARSH